MHLVSTKYYSYSHILAVITIAIVGCGWWSNSGSNYAIGLLIEDLFM
jgi:hypothetical protein